MRSFLKAAEIYLLPPVIRKWSIFYTYFFLSLFSELFTFLVLSIGQSLQIDLPSSLIRAFKEFEV